MLQADGAVGLLLLGLWIYCIFDVVTTDESLVRHLPKMVWLFIVFFLPDIGSVIWLVAGRPERASFRIGDNSARPSHRPIGPEDRASFGGADPENLSPLVREREERAEMRMREEQLRRREEELRRREEALRKDRPPAEPT